jgi:DNA-binding NtrC family response regulator
VRLAIGPAITLADLPPAITRSEHPSRGHVAHAPSLADPERPGPPPDMLSASDDASVMLPREWLEGERAYSIGVLQASGGRIGASARAAGLAERSLFETMKRHGLRKEDFRGPRR